MQELEGVIAELTAQLQEKGEAKANEREFERNRGMCPANMASKFAELAELKDRRKGADGQGQDRQPRGGPRGGPSQPPSGLQSAPGCAKVLINGTAEGISAT